MASIITLGDILQGIVVLIAVLGGILHLNSKISALTVKVDTMWQWWLLKKRNSNDHVDQ